MAEGSGLFLVISTSTWRRLMGAEHLPGSDRVWSCPQSVFTETFFFFICPFLAHVVRYAVYLYLSHHTSSDTDGTSLRMFSFQTRQQAPNAASGHLTFPVQARFA